MIETDELIGELKTAIQRVVANMDAVSGSSIYFLLSCVDTNDLDGIVKRASLECDPDRTGRITFEDFANSGWALAL